MSDRLQAFIEQYRELVEKFGYTIESATMTAEVISKHYSDMSGECYDWLLANMPEADQIV